ncbi:MAG: YigZ family protein [Coriobacteriia bacterium]|nr:YigZ family protein [Coriobacteriia bacterium]
MASYTTIEGRAEAEIEEKKSRFIAQVAHVETEEEALAFLEEIRAKHRTARHNVYAYVLRAENRVRYSDDGEPQKTAGLPTLEAIQHAGLVDVAVVVTRYFGGTLLGTGGLVRAYTQCTQAGLAAARKVVVSRCVDIRITMAYPQYDQVTHTAKQYETMVVDAQFTHEVTLTLRMLEGSETELLQAVREIMRGQGAIDVSEAFDAPFCAGE